MTMPDERARALIRARELLTELAQSREPVVGQAARERANDVPRHYPDDGMLAAIAKDTIWLDWPRRI